MKKNPKARKRKMSQLERTVAIRKWQARIPISYHRMGMMKAAKELEKHVKFKKIVPIKAKEVSHFVMAHPVVEPMNERKKESQLTIQQLEQKINRLDSWRGKLERQLREKQYNDRPEIFPCNRELINVKFVNGEVKLA